MSTSPPAQAQTRAEGDTGKATERSSIASGSSRQRNYGAATQTSNTPTTRSSSPTEKKTRWYTKFTTIELENKGSVARDHLALERTFLAWLRTSLAFASIGVAITQLFRLTAKSDDHNENSRRNRIKQLGKPLGSTFLGIAIVILAIGTHRYYESQEWLMRGKFPASRGGVVLITIVTGLLMIASLTAVLSVGTMDFEE